MSNGETKVIVGMSYAACADTSCARSIAWGNHSLFYPAGSGSLEKDSPIEIIAMKKEQETGLVHDHRLGKREGHADKTGQSLAQRVIPPLDMGGFSRLAGPRRYAAALG